MPNHVTNELRFHHCTEERFHEILKDIQNDEYGLGSIDFRKLIPEPEGLYMGDLGTEEMKYYKDNNWYDWRVKNWNTKWNAYGFEAPTYSGDAGTMTFLTANCSPFRVLFKLSEKYSDVEFELRYADEDLGYNVGEISFAAGELIDDNTPRDGTAAAQELAADILGIDLTFDVSSASGYVLSLFGNYYEYCEGVHVSPPFRCDASLGHPVVLCYDEDNGKVWLEPDRLQDNDSGTLEEAVANIRAWGVHRCDSWDDYNGYVHCLGDDAMESACHNGEGMTQC